MTRSGLLVPSVLLEINMDSVVKTWRPEGHAELMAIYISSRHLDLNTRSVS